jgi:predicted amidohydrolase YtcJ
MARHADVVFQDGSVFDGIRLLPPGTAVAVVGEQIAAIVEAPVPRGPADVSAWIGPDTEVVDLAGGLLLPGFVDAHVHPIEGGLERMRCDLSGGTSRTDYLNITRDYAVGHPDASWILGGGWQMAAFPGGNALASDLDAIVSDRPVFLSNRDHHGAWVNSVALALAGIDRDTPDPPDGRIERDAHGVPSGVLHEGARLLVSQFIPDDTDEENYAALMNAQSYLASFGITGWQDAIVGDYGTHSDTGDTYLRAAENGDLTATVVAALWWDRNSGLEQVERLIARRAQLSHARFSASSVKIMQDGIPENQTAAMIDPYYIAGVDARGCRCATSVRSSGSGHSFVTPRDLNAAVSALDAHGFQVHVHAIGDRAVRESLDAFAVARAAHGSNDLRHHIAHIQIVHPDDISRFASLDVTANIQALWAVFEPQMVELNLPVLGEERSAWQYPFGDLVRTGAALCAGSDWPVTSPDPWAALHVAVNRLLPADHPDYSDRPFYPAQALNLETALAAYTSGSSRINHQDRAGRIVTGFDADLVVTDTNPFARDCLEIASTRTRQSWIRGHRVYGD